MQLKLVFAFGVVGIGLMMACTQDAQRPDLPATLGSSEPVEVVSADGTSSALTAAGGCQDVGAFVGDALSARVITTDLETTSWVSSDRPQPVKVTLLASGTAKELVDKSTDLGTGVNANFATCSHCFVVAIGCAGTDCSRAALFYPRAGTATFTSLSTGPDRTFQGHLDDVELVQVTVERATQTSTPVAKGACMKVSSLTFKAVAPKATPADPKGGTSTSSSSSAGGPIAAGGPPAPPGDGKSSTSSSSSSSSGGVGGTTKTSAL